MGLGEMGGDKKANKGVFYKFYTSGPFLTLPFSNFLLASEYCRYPVLRITILPCPPPPLTSLWPAPSPSPRLALVGRAVCKGEPARAFVGPGPPADPAAVAKEQTPEAKRRQEAAAGAAHRKGRDRRLHPVVVAAVAVKGRRAVVERGDEDGGPCVGGRRGAGRRAAVVIVGRAQREHAREHQTLQGKT